MFIKKNIVLILYYAIYISHRVVDLIGNRSRSNDSRVIVTTDTSWTKLKQATGVEKSFKKEQNETEQKQNQQQISIPGNDRSRGAEGEISADWMSHAEMDQPPLTPSLKNIFKVSLLPSVFFLKKR